MSSTEPSFHSLLSELEVDPTSKAIRRGIKDLQQIGVRPGGMLLVHSSFTSVRQKAKSIENVIAALALALGDDGTLLLPALTYERVNRTSPVFDIFVTPSNVGVIPEFYRTLASTVRSMHPTHSVCACGANSKVITSGHEKDRTPVGPNSPFRKLMQQRGQLLMLGCGLLPNTSMHGVEEMADAPYLLGPPVSFTLKKDGRTVGTYTYSPHAFDGWRQRYDRVKNVLKPPDLVHGRIFGTKAWLIEVAALWSACQITIGAHPYYFVEHL